MNFDPRLVQRLTRPLKHPGVTNHRMSDGLLERFQALGNRLPLLDQQLSRWSTIVELDTEQVPIVYAQSPELDDQVGDDFQDDFVAKKKEVRSPVQKSITSITNTEIPIVKKPAVEKDSMDVMISPITTEIENVPDSRIIQQELQQESQQELSSSSIVSVEASSNISAIASSSEQELSFVQLSPQNLSPQKSDSPTIDQGLPIASEVLPKTSVLPDLRSDLAIEPTQKEQNSNQGSISLQSPIISTVELVSNTQTELAQPLVIQPVSDGVIQARHDSAAPINFHASEQAITSSPIDSVETVMPVVAIAPEISPAMIGDLDMPMLQAHVSENKSTIDNFVVNPISTEVNPDLDTSLVMQEIQSNSANTVVSPVTPNPAIDSETTPITINAVSEPIIQAKEDVSARTSTQINRLINPISESIGVASAIVDSTPELSFVQIPQNLDSSATDQDSFITSKSSTKASISPQKSPQNLPKDPAQKDPTQKESTQTLQPLSQIVDLPQIPIVEILNSPFTLSSEPLSFVPNIFSEASENQLPPSQVQQINPINTQSPEYSQPIQQIIPVNTQASEQSPLTLQIGSESQTEIAQPLIIQPVSEGVIQARYDSAAPSILNAQPVITAADPWLGSLAEVPEISWTSSSENPQNPIPIAIVSAAPITPSTPPINTSLVSSIESPNLIEARNMDDQIIQNQPDLLVQRIIQEPSLVEQTLEPQFNSAFEVKSVNPATSTFQPNLAIQNPVTTDFATQNPVTTTVVNVTPLSNQTLSPTIYSPQDSLVFSSNSTTHNENQVATIPTISKTDTSKINNPKINTQKTNNLQTKQVPEASPSKKIQQQIKSALSSPITDTQKQTDSSLLRTQIVREIVSNSNLSLPLTRVTDPDPQTKEITVKDNLARSSPTQDSIVPTVQAIIEIPEQTYEPLLLSRHNPSALASDMTGNYPNQSSSSSQAIANSSNITTYPISTSSRQNHLSTQSTLTQSSTVSNPSHQVPNTVLRPQNSPELKESNSASTDNTINMDLLVAQVERKIIKRLIVEGERRGKRKWL